MKAKALDDAITNMLREVETETLIDYVAEVKAKAEVDALADTLADLETATLMADAKAKASSRCSGYHAKEMDTERPMETFVNLEAEAVVNALADTQVVVVPERLTKDRST